MKKNIKPKFVNINYTKIYVKINHSKQLQSKKLYTLFIKNCKNINLDVNNLFISYA